MNKSYLRFASIASFALTTFAACSSGEGPAPEQEQHPGESPQAEAQLGESQDEASPEAQLGSTEQGVMSCSNPDGANSAMAAFAVAVAQDLGRWQAAKDFVIIKTNGSSESGPFGYQESIKLASGSDASGPKGKGRCADGTCARTQALLDMQYEQARNKVYFQGSGSTKVLLDPIALRSRLVAKLREQIAFDGRARDGAPDQAPREEHKLAFISAAKGGCDTMFTFQATKPDGSTLRYPNQLKYKLAFADMANPYIGFQNLGAGKVAIDPTWGLNEDGTSSGGSCQAICTKISLANVAGQCCSCGGLTKSFAKASYSATTYLCQ